MQGRRRHLGSPSVRRRPWCGMPITCSPLAWPALPLYIPFGIAHLATFPIEKHDPRTVMDAKKIEALKQKYAGTHGGEIFHPPFAAVAAQVFSNADQRKWPFAGAATFLGLPYRPEWTAVPDLGGLDVALIGVPMDLGVTNRAGARLGPRAVRAVERIGPYEHALGLAPMTMLKVADVGDVPMKSRYSLADCHADIEACFTQVVAAGVLPLAVGGDHSVTGSILKALGRDRAVGMVHIDAHCDTAGSYEGS